MICFYKWMHKDEFPLQMGDLEPSHIESVSYFFDF